MKKFITLCLLIAFVAFGHTGFTQIIFQEHFDPPSTFPTGWKIVDVDKRVPVDSDITDAWILAEDEPGNLVAISTSWYTPSGQSNDWMWTPAITLNGSTVKRLRWRAKAYDPDYRDGYEVRIMTVPPTGTKGNIGNMISASTVYFSVVKENANWTERYVDITALNGSTIYVGFRNNSNDQFMLAIDDIIVEAVYQTNASVTKPINSTGEYFIKPLNQIVNPLPLEASILNLGLSNLTNVKLSASVYNSSNNLVYTATSSVVPVLTPTSSKVFTIPAWTPTVSGDFTVKYTALSDGIDDYPADNTVEVPIYISDSVLARDNDDFDDSFGLGIVSDTVPKAYMGQSFEISSEVYATSITIGYGQGYIGRKYAAVIWNTDEFGTPSSIVASTDTLTYTTNDFFTAELPIHGGKFLLTPGLYVVTAVEFDSTIVLDYTTKIYTAGTLWAYVGGFFGGVDEWVMLEDVADIYNPFQIRLNLKSAGQLPVTLISFKGKNTKNGNELEWKVGDQIGIKEYVVEKSSDGNRFEKIGSVKANTQSAYTYQFTDKNVVDPDNFYRLKIVDVDQFKYSDIVRISNTAFNSILTVSPNPTRNMVTLMSNDNKLLQTNAVLTNMEGKTLQQLKITQLPFKINLSNLPKGMYFLKLSDKSIHKIIKE